MLARRLQGYLRWRNANTRHPEVLAAQRRERARVHSEREQRWGRPRIQAISRMTNRPTLVTALDISDSGGYRKGARPRPVLARKPAAGIG